MRLLQRRPSALTIAEIDEALRHAAEARANGRDVIEFVDDLLDKRLEATA